jgi:hypothetical protein
MPVSSLVRCNARDVASFSRPSTVVSGGLGSKRGDNNASSWSSVDCSLGAVGRRIGLKPSRLRDKVIAVDRRLRPCMSLGPSPMSGTVGCGQERLLSGAAPGPLCSFRGSGPILATCLNTIILFTYQVRVCRAQLANQGFGLFVVQSRMLVPDHPLRSRRTVPHL